MAKKVKNKKFTTLNELMDETLGKVGTPKRDKFDNNLQKETKRDLKNVIKGKGTLIDMDIITCEDLKEYSYDEMLDKAYGKKGTPTRIAAEKRIKGKAKNLLKDIEKKEAKYKKECIKKSEEFLKFALEFSKRASTLSAGDKIPHIYRSKGCNFTIDYYLKIRDRKTGKIIPTSARINRVTGIIEVSKELFIKHNKKMRNTILVSLSIGFDWSEIYKDILKNGKGNKQIKSTKVLVKRKPKKGNASKVRKGKKNPIGQKNSKKSGSIK